MAAARRTPWLVRRLASTWAAETGEGGASSEGGTRMADFGYRRVPEEEKSKLVGNVFRNVAEKYDLMNDVMSVGMHRLWKDRLVSLLAPFPGMQHLDVAGGTGDVAFRIVTELLRQKRRVGAAVRAGGHADDSDVTRVTVCDISAAMLEVGKRRAAAKGWGQLSVLDWLEGDAEALPLADESMDGYTIAFGIRNVTRKEEALKEAYRVLRPGGRFLCLELSHVENPVFRQLYDMYSFGVIPTVGEVVANDRQSYQYLVESIRKFPDQRRFATMLCGAGFEHVAVENMAGGVVAIHSGFKLGRRR